MNFKVLALSNFLKEAKRLTKKFPSLRREIDQLLKILVENPQSGTPIGQHCYKIRLAISSKGGWKVKRGSYYHLRYLCKQNSLFSFDL